MNFQNPQQLILSKTKDFRKQIRANQNSITFLTKRVKFQSLIENNPNNIPLSDLLHLMSSNNDISFFKIKLDELKILMNSHNWSHEKIEELMSSGCIDYLIYLLKSPNEQIKLESLLILSNSLMGDTNIIKYCFEKGLLDELINFLSNNDFYIREQAVWGLANMAGDSEEIVKVLLDHKLLIHLLKMLSLFEKTQEFKNTCSWLMANLLRSKKTNIFQTNKIEFNINLAVDDLQIIVEIIEQLLENSITNSESFKNSLFCLNCLAKRHVHKIIIKRILDDKFFMIENLLKIFLTWTDYENECPYSYFLNFLGCLILDNEDDELEKLIERGVFEILVKGYVHKSEKIRKSLLWNLGNLLATNQKIVIKFCDKHFNFMAVILDTIKNDDYFQIKREAIICLSNIINLTSNDKISELVDMGMLETVCSILDIYDQDLLIILLDIVEETLSLGNFIKGEESSEINPYIEEIEKFNGRKNIEKLCENNNFKIKEKSISIIDQFFNKEEISFN